MKYYMVDTFTDEVFGGNPAGVCILDKKISPEIMQRIAKEHNLPETAFVLKEEINIHYVGLHLNLKLIYVDMLPLHHHLFL